jgi:hypothetical protein
MAAVEKIPFMGDGILIQLISKCQCCSPIRVVTTDVKVKQGQTFLWDFGKPCLNPVYVGFEQGQAVPADFAEAVIMLEAKPDSPGGTP